MRKVSCHGDAERLTRRHGHDGAALYRHDHHDARTSVANTAWAADIAGTTALLVRLLEVGSCPVKLLAV